MIVESSIEHFLDALASKSPTPGGGSAAAIIGAMGAALVSMVCNLTIGKKNYEEVGADMVIALEQAEALRARLVDLVRADIEVFDLVMAAYRLPKETESEKDARSQRIQEALKAATRVPLDCAEACAEVISLCQAVAEKGNRNVITDAGVGVMAAYAALRSADLNVHVNVGVIKDEVFVADSMQRLGRIIEGMEKRVQDTYQIVRERL